MNATRSGGATWTNATALALRAALGGLFVVSGALKIADAPGFAVAVFRYDLLPDGAINAVAVFLPWLELLAGAAFLGAPRLRRGAWAWIVVLLATFTAAMVAARLRGMDIPCGCWDPSLDDRIGAGTIGRNVALLAAAGAWRWLEPRAES